MTVQERLQQNAEVPQKQFETERSIKNVLITFSKSVLLSLDRNLDGIDKNPALALREALFLPQDTELVSEFLGFDVGDGSDAENNEKKCKKIQKFLTTGAINTVRTVSSKAADKKELTDDEQSLMNTREYAFTPDGEKLTPGVLKKVLDKHFVIDCNPDDSDEIDENKTIKKGESMEETRTRYLLSRQNNTSTWRTAQEAKIPYIVASRIEKMFVLKNGHAVPKLKE